LVPGDWQNQCLGFLPEEDQGFLFINVQLPFAASLDRTVGICRQAEEIALATPE